MVVVGTGTSGSKELKTNWPVVEGIIAGETKLDGSENNLIAEHDLTEDKDKVGI